MNRAQKIKMLELIEAGELTSDALKIEEGVYKRTETPGIYRNEHGCEISYNSLKEASEHLSFLFEAVTVSNDEYPSLITVRPFPVGWVEEKTYSSIEVVDKETAAAIGNLFQKE